MAPTISVSEETLKTLNPEVYTLVNRVSDDPNFIFIPSINLHVARKRTHLDKNWFESHKELQNNGERMLTMPEFMEVLKYTKESHQDTYEEITKVGDPWRAEWLDVDFKIKDGKLYINSNHIYQSGVLAPQTSEILQANTLMKNKTPGISLDDYIQNPTKQGLPSKRTKSGNLYYWAPMSDNNSVARFDADDDRADLCCYGDPSDWYSYLGVRAVRSGK